MPNPEDYTHQGDLFRFGYTQCAECGDLLHQDEAEKKTYYDQTGEMKEEHFCPSTNFKTEENCHHKWYLRKLREGGL